MAVAQSVYRFFSPGDELPHWDEGTTPVIEAADITTSGSNTATASPSVAYPAYNTGDLLIFLVAIDDDDTINIPATGPNGETRVILTTSFNPGTNGPSVAGYYFVATSNQSSGNQGWTLSLAEEWLGRVIKVPAGEFDPITPIQFVNDPSGANTEEGGWEENAWVNPRANGRIVGFMSADTDPWATPPTGWTQRNTQDIGAVSVQIVTRDAATTAGESVPGFTDFRLSGTNVDSLAGFMFVVSAPRTADGRTPLANPNTSADLDVDTAYGCQVRFDFDSGGNPEASAAFKWQYRLNGGTWTDLTGSSSVVQALATADFADADDALEYLGFGNPDINPLVANNNAAKESNGAFTTGTTPAALQAVESHLNFQVISGDVADNDTIELRIVFNNGTVFGSYTNIATFTVNKPDTGITFSGGLASPASAVSGNVSVLVGISGALNSQAAAMSGNVSIIVSVNGALNSQSSTMAGNASIIVGFTGSLLSDVSVLAGNLSVIAGFSGALLADVSTISGNFTVDDAGAITFTGTLLSAASAMAGDLSVIVDLSGALVSGSPALAGDLSVIGSFSGNLVADLSTVAGNVSVIAGFDGTLLAAASAISGTFDPRVDFSGALLSPASSMVASLSVIAGFEGSLLAQAAVIAGSMSSVDRVFSGTLAADSSALAGSLSVLVDFLGTLRSGSSTISSTLSVIASFSGAVVANNSILQGEFRRSFPEVGVRWEPVRRGSPWRLRVGRGR